MGEWVERGRKGEGEEKDEVEEDKKKAEWIKLTAAAKSFHASPACSSALAG